MNEIRSIIDADTVPMYLVRQATYLMSNLMKMRNKSKDFLIESMEVLSTILYWSDQCSVLDCWYAFMSLATAKGMLVF